MNHPLVAVLLSSFLGPCRRFFSRASMVVLVSVAWAAAGVLLSDGFVMNTVIFVSAVSVFALLFNVAERFFGGHSLSRLSGGVLLFIWVAAGVSFYCAGHYLIGPT